MATHPEIIGRPAYKWELDMIAKKEKDKRDMLNYYATMDSLEMSEPHRIDVPVHRPAEAFGKLGFGRFYDFHISTALSGVYEQLAKDLECKDGWMRCGNPGDYFMRGMDRSRVDMYERVVIPDSGKPKTINIGEPTPNEEATTYKLCISSKLHRQPTCHVREDIMHHCVVYVYPSDKGGGVDTFQLLRCFKGGTLESDGFNMANRTNLYKNPTTNVDYASRLLACYAWRYLSQSEEGQNQSSSGVNAMVYERNSEYVVGALLRRSSKITHSGGASIYTFKLKHSHITRK